MTNYRIRAFEKLEDRALLAGNVTAAVVDGCLTVTGDSKDNIIAVHQTQSGDWVVNGFSKTKINGGSSDTFSEVSCIHISMCGGNDVVGVATGCLPQELDIDTAGGNDLVALVGLKVGSVDVTTGSGIDALIVVGLETLAQETPENPSAVSPLSVTEGNRGSAMFDTGDATDFVLLAGVKAGNLSLCTGKGNDYVGMLGVCVDECLNVDIGSGADMLGVAKSSASFAKFYGGSDPGDLCFTALNDFGDTSSSFKTTIKLDALAKSIASYIKSFQPMATTTLGSLGKIPTFKI